MATRRQRRRNRVVAAFGAVLTTSVVAACGTTVPSSQAPASSAEQLGTVPQPVQSAPTAPGTTAASESAPQVLLPTATHAHGGRTASTGTTTTPTGTTSLSTTPTGAPPTGPIKVGYGYVDSGSTNSVLSGIGKGLTSADLHGEIEAYVQHINAAGGVLGRQLELVFYRASTSESLQQIGQALCATETQDNHVDVSLDDNYGSLVFPCMAKAGIPTIYTGLDGLTEANYRAFPLVSEPDSISIDRLAAVEVPQLVKLGYQPTGRSRLGVLYFNSPNFVTGFNALKSAWAKEGVKVASSASLANYNTVGQIAGLGAGVQAAELKFRAQGVTHVMCVETNAFLCGFFGLFAASQGYYPRYAYTSDQPLTNILANVPARALQNAVFVGWNPAQDLSVLSKMPASYRSCFAFMNKHGFSTATGNEKDGAASICESIDYLVAAIKAGGGASPAQIVAGERKLGGSYVSEHSLGIGDRQDGAAVVRRGRYSPSCKCFAYTGPPVHLQ